MLRFLASPAARAVQKAASQQRTRALQVAARRPANARGIASSRSRLAAEKPAAEGATKEGQKAPDALVLTPYEKVSATATGGFWLGLISLGAVGVYFVARELLPNIKYNIKGPTGHAYVFAEVNQGMKKNEYVYLIVQVTKTGELLKIIDNRQILAAETKEEQDALRQLLGKY
ncbi:hypothetical protein BBJ28_00009180 [Nothophytophthora sp. Chile5]|nr:hypothetical protein BBJ28_00009180 [Nothophytophthora sp. Chile5]